MTPSTDPDERISRIRVGIERKRCIGGQRGVAVTGSSSEICRCLVPRLGQFLTSPRFIPDGGIAPVRLGIAAFP
jgi:hypothetical protein